jgi:hypothetical protein
MQMMPSMLNKVYKYGQIQAMSALGNAGLLGSAPMMPSMPMMPCCMPSSFSMPMAAPMMAAATPLPVAFNPLVQGMYPMASMSPVNWMTPSSFMSALTSGPMPYRPPAFDFPSNVGMVMTIPYGTPNPLLSSPPFGGFGSAYNSGGGFPWNCCYSVPPVTIPAPPTISYYPRPICVPQPYPVPYPAPVAIPNVQQIPVPRPVSVVAPPIVAGSHHPLPVSAGVPLWSSQGGFTDNGFSRPAVMLSNNNSVTQASTNYRPRNGSLPVYDATDKSCNLIDQPVISSLSNPGSNNNQRPDITPSTAKNAKQLSQIRDNVSTIFRRHMPSIPHLSRSNHNLSTYHSRSDPVLPPILCGQVISDSGWLPKTSKIQAIKSILSGKRGKRSLYTPTTDNSILYSSSSGASLIKRRRRNHSGSSTSEYDCAICQQERDKKRLREYFGPSTVSSLLSSPKDSPRRHLSTYESALSSTTRSQTLFKQDNYKSHRRHPIRTKIKRKTPSPTKSTSPILLRRSPIREQKLNETIHEEELLEKEKEEEQIEEKLIDNDDSIVDKFDHYTSKTSLKSTDE